MGVVGVFGKGGGPDRLFAFAAVVSADFFAFAISFALRSFAVAAFVAVGLAFFALADFLARFAAWDFILFVASIAFVRFVMALLFLRPLPEIRFLIVSCSFRLRPQIIYDLTACLNLNL